MMLSGLDLTILVVYMLVVLWIGYFTMNKITSFSDYSVAGDLCHLL